MIRYLSDPRANAGTPGLWRTVSNDPRELISPFALTRIETGRGSNVEIAAIRPGTEDERLYEGDLDVAATLLWRAGQRFGCWAERKTLYWALFEFCALARRQAAARGVA